MADLPAHPDTGDGADQTPDRLGGRPRRLPLIGIVVVAALVVAVIVLHVTGVIGPGSH